MGAPRPVPRRARPPGRGARPDWARQGGARRGAGRSRAAGRACDKPQLDRRGTAMTRRQRRLSVIGTAGFVLAAALGLVLYAMHDTIVFFRAPSEIAAKAVAPGTRFRLGGLVENGTVERSGDQIVTFKVGDGAATV